MGHASRMGPLDPDIRALLPEFIEHWERQLSTGWWARLRAAGDAGELRRLGHTVKGSFAQFGMIECAAFGPALMDCAATGEWARADAIVGDLRSRLSALRAEATPPSP
jgi:hypothetical protein